MLVVQRKLVTWHKGPVTSLEVNQSLRVMSSTFIIVIFIKVCRAEYVNVR